MTAKVRSEPLARALAARDAAAVALALRHGNVVVPLMREPDSNRPGDAGDVWTYRDPKSGEVALLLFSDAAHAPPNLPQHVALFGGDWLRDFLTEHDSVISTVFFDIAGPAPMQAAPADLRAALA